ncbi:MAG: TonB family protein [Thermoanaerobaculaceae bacterium]|nr:TonB family protein [Thermoanaerobaculaceae bacterium]
MGRRGSRVPAVAAALLVCLASAVAAAGPPEPSETRGQISLVLFFKKALLGPEKTPVEVTGDIRVGKPATKGHLEYPPDVLADGIGGTVEVAILVDDLGRVTSARISRGVDPRLDALCLEAARGISFGPSRRKDGRPVGLAVMAAYNFIPGGTPKTQTGPGVTPGWEKEFKKAYALNEGEVLKLVRPPFPLSRMDFYRTSNPGQAKAIPEGPSQMTVRWDGESGRLECEGLRFGGSDLEGLLQSLGIARYAISADPGLLGAEVRCDLVVRKGATPEECVPALENVLRTVYKLPVRMTFKDEEREVIVAKGSYALRPPQNGGDNAEVQIFDRDLDPGPGHAGGGTTSVAGLLEVLAETLQCPVVSEVEPTHASVRYVVNRDASRTAYVDDVLHNVSAQTGLVFAHQTRTVRVLNLEKAE